MASTAARREGRLVHAFLLHFLLVPTGMADTRDVLHGADDFDTFVFGPGDNRSSLIQFIAPWCPHCRAMAPDWALLGAQYESSAALNVASVDCTSAANEELCGRLQVRGSYPTIFYFTPPNREPEPYEGARDATGLLPFAEEELAGACEPLRLDACADEEQARLARQFFSMAIGDLEEMAADVRDDYLDAAKAKLTLLQMTYEEATLGELHEQRRRRPMCCDRWKRRGSRWRAFTRSMGVRID
jgi:thiol-disulfide isomerase/thioredoxin